MKVILQRVKQASVSVEGRLVSEIGQGLLLLVGFGKDDNESKLQPMAKKLLNLRIFSDESGRFHHSLLELDAEVLAIPQFTLYGDTTKGRRPEFFSALEPTKASPMFDKFCQQLEAQGAKKVGKGEFGADMQVALVNSGPVTLQIEL